eukprot:TRINITY_DN43767_c0_g1_i1.p1 TRINITY_DN43767_c0_g1~~TRINITY_DN43767_c0_g1_i1.p1  ORF type:complete len:597 (+),score=81.75 TRINITY_DN43767_c0_g1_i1:32-1822(+)
MLTNWFSNFGTKPTSPARRVFIQPLQPVVAYKDTHACQYIRAVQLGQWHNLQGPVLLAIWNSPTPTESTEDESLRRINRVVLLGEMARIDYNHTEQLANIETKSNLLPEMKVTASSALFSATKPGGPKAQLALFTTKYCLSIITDLDHLPFMCHFSAAITDRLRQLALYLHRLFSRTADEKEVIKELQPELRRFIEHLDAWIATARRASIRVDIHSTLLGQKLCDTDREFFMRAASAFLQTHGYAVVRAEKVDSMLPWVRALALLLSEKDRMLVRLPTLSTATVYIPEVRLQGLLTSAKCEEDELLYSRFPVAIIDINKAAVKVLGLQYNVYTVFRRNFFECQYTRESQQPRPSPLIKKYRAIAPVVRSLVNTCSDSHVIFREGLIQNWRKYLLRKAACLVRYISSQSNQTLFAITEPATTTISSTTGDVASPTLAPAVATTVPPPIEPEIETGEAMEGCTEEEHEVKVAAETPAVWIDDPSTPAGVVSPLSPVAPPPAAPVLAANGKSATPLGKVEQADATRGVLLVEADVSRARKQAGHMQLARKMWQELDVEDEEDQRIVLAFAEKLRPNTYMRVQGDIVEALETILHGLESF